MIEMLSVAVGAASLDMTWLEMVVLSIVEGLTEFLPVSSTGHMIVAEGLMGMKSTPFLKAFDVIIQFGAILSVVVLYWRRFFYPQAVADGVESWWKAVGLFYVKLLVGLLPAVVIGLTLGDFIDQNLESVWTVAVMLVVGGVFMLFCDRWFDKGSEQTKLTYRRSFVIGMYQCIAALLPGTSRSMATIVGGMQQKLTRRAAAEFSFFLAVPTMAGAACKKGWDLYKDGGMEALTGGDHLAMLLLGNVIAFFVALLAIRFFIDYVSRFGFRAFGWYRIAVGAVIIVLMMCGVELGIH